MNVSNTGIGLSAGLWLCPQLGPRPKQGSRPPEAKSNFKTKWAILRCGIDH